MKEYQDTEKEPLLLPRNIYFVRHGQTTANLSGQLERDPMLTVLGMQQAQEAGVSLRDLQPALIVHTGLSRTKQTAEILVTSGGFQNTPMISMDAFLERDMGIYDGSGALERMLAHDGMQELYQQYGLSCVWFFDGNDGEGVEPLARMRERIQQGLELLYPHFGNAPIIVAAHEGSIKMAQLIYEGVGEDMPRLLAGRRIANCEVRNFPER